MLSTNRPLDPDADGEEIERILAAACLTPAASSKHVAGTWQRAHVGLIVLAGEIAARTLSAVIAHEHDGPDGFEALDNLINHIYSKRTHPRNEHPVMAVSRMLRTRYGAALPAWQRRAIRLIVHRYNGGYRDGVRADAQISAHIAPRCHGYQATIAQVRRQVVSTYLEAVQAPS